MDSLVIILIAGMAAGIFLHIQQLVAWEVSAKYSLMATIPPTILITTVVLILIYGTNTPRLSYNQTFIVALLLEYIWIVFSQLLLLPPAKRHLIRKYGISDYQFRWLNMFNKRKIIFKSMGKSDERR